MSNKGAHFVWIVSGPSGSGKTSLCSALLKDSVWKKRLMRSVSYTTRKLRSGEKDGIDYKSVSEKEFLRLKAGKAFLETEKIFGCYYGTPKKSVEVSKRQGKDLLLCIDVKGAKSVKREIRKNAISIFVIAPGFKELVKRLKKRSTENKKDIEKRLERVKMELSYMGDYDYIVVNGDFNKALGELKAILTAKRCEESYVLYSLRKTDR